MSACRMRFHMGHKGHKYSSPTSDITYHSSVASEVSQGGARCCSQQQATQVVLSVWVQVAREETHKAGCGRDFNWRTCLSEQWVVEDSGRDLSQVWLVGDAHNCCWLGRNHEYLVVREGQAKEKVCNATQAHIYICTLKQQNSKRKLEVKF